MPESTQRFPGLGRAQLELRVSGGLEEVRVVTDPWLDSPQLEVTQGDPARIRASVKPHSATLQVDVADQGRATSFDDRGSVTNIITGPVEGPVVQAGDILGGVDLSGEGIRAGGQNPTTGASHAQPTITVYVPTGISVKVHDPGNSAVHLDGRNGRFDELDIKTSNGGVTVDGTFRHGKISTINGPVDVARVEGTGVIKTVNGKIEVAYADPKGEPPSPGAKPLTAHSVNGPVTVVAANHLQSPEEVIDARSTNRTASVNRRSDPRGQPQARRARQGGRLARLFGRDPNPPRDGGHPGHPR